MCKKTEREGVLVKIRQMTVLEKITDQNPKTSWKNAVLLFEDLKNPSNYSPGEDYRPKSENIQEKRGSLKWDPLVIVNFFNRQKSANNLFFKVRFFLLKD